MLLKVKESYNKYGMHNLNYIYIRKQKSAFFPFDDCLEAAHEVGISAIIQLGGSTCDKDSIEKCN